MYEVFLQACIPDEDFKSVCAILCGLCEMQSPWRSTHRVLSYQGPVPVRGGLMNLGSADQEALRKDPANQGLWTYLHSALLQQSYLVQLRYDISKERDFGPGAPPTDFAMSRGILRWAAFPDPPMSSKPLLLQRKIVELWEQRNLPTVMTDNGYAFKNELVEETCRFFRGDTEFVLWRSYLTRPEAFYVPLEEMAARLTPVATLPAWDALQPMDEAGRWLMLVKTYVQSDNKPDDLAKAQDALMAVRRELEGAIEFKPFSRKFHDPRVPRIAQTA